MALVVVIALALGAAAIAVIAYTSFYSNVWNDADRVLLNEVDAFQATIGGDPEDELSVVDASRTYLEARSQSEGGRTPILLAVFENGKVLSNSSITLESIDENTGAVSPMTAEAGLSLVTDGDVTYRVVSVPITGAEGVRIGVFQSALATDETERVLDDLVIALALAVFVVIALAALLSGRVASAALRPLRQMASTAATVSTASLHQRVGYDGPDDELGVLAASLDSMLDRLESSFDEQKRFVADASHELRTPLTIISGHLEAAESQSDDHDRAESLRVAREEVTRMSRLVEDLLALARLDAGPPRSFQQLHLPTLATEVAHRANAIGSRIVQLRCEGDAWVMGDPDLLEHVALNLIGNAFQHTPETAEVTLSCTTEGASALLRVTDTGPGIAAEDLPRLFDRFFRASDARGTETEGSGLGLAIAKRLVELHNGTLSVNSREGEGTTFSVALPTTEAPE